MVLGIFLWGWAVTMASGAERTVSTVGVVQREVPADRASLSVEVSAAGVTLEIATRQLEARVEELRREVVTLGYPTSAVSVRLRSAGREREWDEGRKKWAPTGYEATASVGLVLVGLSRHGAILSFLGTREGYQISWQSMGSSMEGDVRRKALAEALEAAREKAEILARVGRARVGNLIEAIEEDVSLREFEGSTWAGNSPDPRAGTGAHPLGVHVRVRARFELIP